MNIDNYVLAAQQGDRAAAELVVESFQPLVAAAAAQRHLKPVAEDALAEARLSLWLAIRCFNPGKGIPFAGYAKAKVYHDLRSFFRREARRWQWEVLPDQLSGPEEKDYFDNLLDEHDGTREFIALQELLDPLTPRQRQLLRLTYIQGLSQQETAARLHISQSAVSNGIKKALQKLRTELTD